MYIKNFEESDKQAFLDLCKSFYSGGATTRDYSEAIAVKTFQQIMDKHENLWGYFIMNNDNDHRVGYAIITSYWCNEEGGNVIIIDELYIGAEDRHKGYGRRFMEWLEEEVKQKAVAITLEVITTNHSAKELYLKEGFTPDGFETFTKKICT